MAPSLEEYISKKYARKSESKVKKYESFPESESLDVKDDTKSASTINGKESFEKKNNSFNVDDLSLPKLSSKSDVLMKQKEEEMRRKLQTLKNSNKNNAIIYRDSQGNIISETEAKKEEENKDCKRKRELEREENITKKNKNEAAIEKERQMRERLQQIRNEGINVYENDEKLIEKQKSEIKDEDPALLFNKKVIKEHKREVSKQFISITGRKLYKDPTRYPMNRFNIKPGWRWDGIVRGNGFEQKWFDKNTK
ncbi:hypothetical protein CANINC_003637 [Pichia inconspicua]|uniref:Pre-mRNA-splicing factor CWC26 n=1 Tax=Pichia inconspicua TaxID=52247 RepID=A0A4T0WY77_9ASCO|nr:hypothetical protein CANINC_003637 [[Candida] inconspicua]